MEKLNLREEKSLNNINTQNIIYQEISHHSVTTKDPLVSVNIVTYNQEVHIRNAIEGVLIQECDFPFELVIGDDFSTDRTREILKEYQKKYPDKIRLILWDNHVGGKKNFITVNYLCRGKYIAICEGDDYWINPKKLQMQVEIMEREPDVGLVHGGVIIYNFETKTNKRDLHANFKYEINYFGKNNKFIENYLSLSNKIPHIYTSTVCMRKDILLRIYNENPDDFSDEFLMGDLQLWLEASRMCRFHYINELLATYNILPESVSNPKDISKLIKFCMSSLNIRLHIINKYNLNNDIKHQVIERYITRLLNLSFRDMNVEIADYCHSALKNINGRLNIRQNLLYLGTTKSQLRKLITIILYLINIYYNTKKYLKVNLTSLIK